MKRVPLVAILAGLVTVLMPAEAVAQEMSDAQMAAMTEALAPDENHARLEALTGSWHHDITFYPAPGAPAMEMTATSTAAMAMGDRYLQSEYSGEFFGMPFTGMETMGYDKVKGKYFSTWIDNFSTGPMVLWGDFDAATSTFTMEGTVSDPSTGNPEVPVRNTIQLMDDGSVHYENWSGDHKSMVIHSTKQ